MMGKEILLYTVNAVTSFLSLVFLLRFYFSANSSIRHSPVFHFVYQLTQWAINPFKKIIPKVGSYEISALLVAWLILSGKELIIWSLRGFDLLAQSGLLLIMALALGMMQILRVSVYLFMLIILVHVLFSWLAPQATQAYLFRELSNKLLSPIKRFLPVWNNIDLSPLVGFFIAQIALIIIHNAERSILAIT